MSTQAVTADGNGIARQFDETLSEAAAVIGQYIVEGDESRPILEQTVDAMALNIVKGKLAAAGRKHRANDPVAGNLLERTIPKVQKFLKNRCTDTDTALDAETLKSERTGNYFTRTDFVYLDFNGVADSGACPPWAPQVRKERDGDVEVTMIPAIAFAFLDPLHDGMYKPGKCEAIAVYVDPNEVAERRTSTWTNGGRSYPVEQVSDWAVEQYVGIVRTFGSVRSVMDAKAQLRRAITDIYTKPVPTDLADDDNNGMPPLEDYADDFDFDDIEGLPDMYDDAE